MGYLFESQDGHCKSNNMEHVTLWNQIVKERKENELKWIEELRAQGVKASHPDDGWVKRDINQVTLCYPEFNDGVSIGDIIALGTYEQCRLVKVIEEREPLLDSQVLMFEPIVEKEESPKQSKWKKMIQVLSSSKNKRK
jgi:hypothetical protein